MLCLIMPPLTSRTGSLPAGSPLIQKPLQSSFVQYQSLYYSASPLLPWSLDSVQHSPQFALCTYLSTRHLPTDTAARPSQLLNWTTISAAPSLPAPTYDGHSNLSGKDSNSTFA